VPGEAIAGAAPASTGSGTRRGAGACTKKDALGRKLGRVGLHQGDAPAESLGRVFGSALRRRTVQCQEKTRNESIKRQNVRANQERARGPPANRRASAESRGSAPGDALRPRASVESRSAPGVAPGSSSEVPRLEHRRGQHQAEPGDEPGPAPGDAPEESSGREARLHQGAPVESSDQHQATHSVQCQEKHRCELLELRWGQHRAEPGREVGRCTTVELPGQQRSCY
jgi:hypothetical protein